MRRSKMNRSKSKSLFSRTGSKTQSINLRGTPMRGGIRL